MDGKQLQAYLDMAGLDQGLHRDVSAPLDILVFHEEIINSESKLIREQILRAIDEMAQVDVKISTKNE